MTIVLSDLRRERNGADIETSIALRIDGTQHRLSIHQSGDCAALMDHAPQFDPFLALMLIPAMARGEKIVVEGSIDARRLDGFKRGLQTIYADLAEGLWQIVPIEAEARVENRQPDLSKGAALGMSCGIDSLYAFTDLARPETPEHLRVKLLMHHHVGAHPDRETFERHYGTARRFAADHGLPLVSARIDLSRYYTGRFVHTASIRNIGAAMSFEPLFHALVYSKDEPGVHPKGIGRRAGIGRLDAVALPLMNTSAHSYLSHGIEIERLGKTAVVVPGDLAPRYLTVCTHSARDGHQKMNCGRCYKCGRALFFAEANGILERFGEMFDLEAFRRDHAHGLRRFLRHTVLNRRTADDRDQLAYLFERDFPMPVWFKLFRKMAGTSSVTKTAHLER